MRPPLMVGNMMRPVAPPASFPSPIQRPGLQPPMQQRPPILRPAASSSAPVTVNVTSVSMKDIKAKQRAELLAHTQSFLNPNNRPGKQNKVEVSANEDKSKTDVHPSSKPEMKTADVKVNEKK